MILPCQALTAYLGRCMLISLGCLLLTLLTIIVFVIEGRTDVPLRKLSDHWAGPLATMKTRFLVA